MCSLINQSIVENDMNSLISRFKASNVAKVGSAYVLVSWVIIQLNDSVLPTFEAPSWVGQTIIFLLILGLPITLVIAWASQSNDDAAPVSYTHLTLPTICSV